MTLTVHMRRSLALSCALIGCLALSMRISAATAPYPMSRLITGISWDFSTVASLRKAAGSDSWPLAWAADGNLYGAWGDGGGFDGDANNIGRVSLGFARITGIPRAGDPTSFAGSNVWGAAPAYAQNRATFGGKIDDLISIDGVLYGQGGLWTSANCNCPDPTLKSGEIPTPRNLIWSADLGKTWHVASWVTPTVLGTTVQYGQDYAGAWDPAHVYFFFQRSVSTDAAHLFLRRVRRNSLTADPATPGHFEYFSAVDAGGRPSWSTIPSRAVPIFFDPNVPAGTFASAGISYDPALGRYLLAAYHGDSTGQIGFFESPTLWGPWSTIAYYEDWGGFNESAGGANGLNLPAKWFSADGKTLWGVFSGVTNGFDSFNLARVVLTTIDGIPRIVMPAAGTRLTAGERVSVQAVGNGLTWSVNRLGDGSTALAAGSGREITFTVPADSAVNSVIRVSLVNPTTSIYRDFTISAAADQAVAAYWKFDEGSGTVAQDSSGAGDSGTLLNGPVWTTGRIGAALSFQGARAAVEVSGARGLANLFQRGLTVTAWIRPRSPGSSGRIVDKDGNAVGWFLKMSGDHLQFVVDQFTALAASRRSASPLALNAWHHVAATWDGSAQGDHIHVYIDGSPSDGQSVSGAGSVADDASIPLTIGNRASDLARGFDGIIDEVHVFDRALDSGEIRALAIRPDELAETVSDAVSGADEVAARIPGTTSIQP